MMSDEWWVGRWVDGRVDGWMCEARGGWMDGWMDGWVCEARGGWVDGPLKG